MDEGTTLTSASAHYLALHSKHVLNLPAATSYDNSTDMPSRFTPQNSRLSQRAPVNVPTNAVCRQIALAMFLFTCGIVLLTIGACILTGVIDADEYWPAEGWKAMAICFTALGSVTFIPGFYITKIAYYAYKGYPGYSFDQIPQYND